MAKKVLFGLTNKQLAQIGGVSILLFLLFRSFRGQSQTTTLPPPTIPPVPPTGNTNQCLNTTAIVRDGNCPNYSGSSMNDQNLPLLNGNPIVVEQFSDQLGLNSDKYCSVKYLQDTINNINNAQNYPCRLVVDGFFGNQTLTEVRRIFNKDTASNDEAINVYQFL
jgi:hypothetical protein